jgi:hypothetical protein
VKKKTKKKKKKKEEEMIPSLTRGALPEELFEVKNCYFNCLD